MPLAHQTSTTPTAALCTGLGQPMASRGRARTPGSSSIDPVRADALLARLNEGIERHDLPMVEQALADGADVNGMSRDGTRPLTMGPNEDPGPACVMMLEIAQCLFSAGADPNLLDQNNLGFLGMVSTYGSLAHVRLALEHGADPNLACASREREDPLLPLVHAVRAQTLDWRTHDEAVTLLDLLLNAGADPSANDQAPLRWATMFSGAPRPRFARRLVEAGANPFLLRGHMPDALAVPMHDAWVQRVQQEQQALRRAIDTTNAPNISLTEAETESSLPLERSQVGPRRRL